MKWLQTSGLPAAVTMQDKILFLFIDYQSERGKYNLRDRPRSILISKMVFGPDQLAYFLASLIPFFRKLPGLYDVF